MSSKIQTPITSELDAVFHGSLLSCVVWNLRWCNFQCLLTEISPQNMVGIASVMRLQYYLPLQLNLTNTCILAYQRCASLLFLCLFMRKKWWGCGVMALVVQHLKEHQRDGCTCLAAKLFIVLLYRWVNLNYKTVVIGFFITSVVTSLQNAVKFHL